MWVIRLAGALASQRCETLQQLQQQSTRYLSHRVQQPDGTLPGMQPAPRDSLPAEDGLQPHRLAGLLTGPGAALTGPASRYRQHGTPR
jgi:hypothetical protein